MKSWKHITHKFTDGRKLDFRFTGYSPERGLMHLEVLTKEFKSLPLTREVLTVVEWALQDFADDPQVRRSLNLILPSESRPALCLRVDPQEEGMAEVKRFFREEI